MNKPSFYSRIIFIDLLINIILLLLYVNYYLHSPYPTNYSSSYSKQNVLESSFNPDSTYCTRLRHEELKRFALISAYPEYIRDINNNYIYFLDGDSLMFDDGISKSYDILLDNSDPEDMFFTVYSSSSLPPEYLSDAGRSRSEKLFKKMYGSSITEVQSHLVNVNWFGKQIKFSCANGAADQLSNVAKELDTNPKYKPFIDCSGTFYWRKVRGANRQSAHSYGIAIDIAVSKSDYWLWNNPDRSELDSIDYRNRIPKGIVEIFEKHGFIWGGAWYHYDTMHFEYRPEIINFTKSFKPLQ